MFRIFLITLAGLCLAAPASAAFKETADSYYGRLMKSCEYTVRETWRDYLLYVPHKRIDECCAESVREMAKEGAKETRNGQCPSGYQPNALKCTSSKRWCEEVKAK
ncbi:MAG: hypothetical protein WBK55_07435 [Alphaproteobacteria bacterium]